MTEHDDTPETGVIDKEHVETLLSFELVRRVLKLPHQTRAKLLAFLHLMEDLDSIECDLQADRSGELSLNMLCREAQGAHRPAGGAEVDLERARAARKSSARPARPKAAE